MIPKATENTITSLVREKLEKLGVKAMAFVSIQTPEGRREVDLWCYDGGSYPIEAKFSETDLVEAISKIYNDYLKHSSYLNIQGGFALLLPEEFKKPMPLDRIRELISKLRFKLVCIFPPEDRRKSFTVHEGNLSDVCRILASYILTPPEYVEPNIPYIIGVLRESAKSIAEAMKDMSGKAIENMLGGRDVFENILQYEEGKYPLEDLRLVISYILVTQLLFYHVISSFREDFPSIDPSLIKKPSDLKEYFKKVYEVNYRAIFSYDIVSLIPDNFTNYIKTIINAIKGIAPEKIKGDLLGTIFHDLVPFEVRKSVAAFYTNVLATELLASLAIDRYDAKVADFACGSGGLLVAAYRRKKELLERERTFMREDHKRFVEEDLLGIDVMPFAAHIAACHLALQAPEYFTNKVNIAIWDSTELEPGHAIPSIAALKFVLRGQTELELFTESQQEVKGVVSLTGLKSEEIKLEEQDVIIMNPPFTRQERIPKEYKTKLLERFSRYKEYLHGQLGYYGYFIFLADKFLKENGRVALVLPATILMAKSCQGIRKFLSENYHIEYIITTHQRSAFSESARFREILLIAKKLSSPNRRIRETYLKIAILKKLPSTLIEARAFANLIREAIDYEDDRIKIFTITYNEFMMDTENWFKFIMVNPDLLIFMKKLLESFNLVDLSTLCEPQRLDLQHLKFGDFHGFILFDERRAIKKTDVWVLERREKDQILAKHRGLSFNVSVPLEVLQRGLRRLSHVDTIDISSTADYLITGWFRDIMKMASQSLSKEQLGRFNENIVNSWKNRFESRKTHVLMGRRFDISAPGTKWIAFYSDTEIVGTDHFWCLKGLVGDDAKIVTLWLNSTFSLLQLIVKRKETRGAWMKVEEYTLKEIKIPPIPNISSKDKRVLLETFEKIKNVKPPSIFEQLKNKFWGRQLIDNTWLKVLGYKGDPTSLLDTLYDLLSSEIELLKIMMAENSTTSSSDNFS
jgi:type I restriction-modification system DNA methylase subunit